ncbi:hypothetical protein CJ030_MR1G018616 [Morella rubra]|uniref:Uncharacterized protein n=1 Tax=Morella rubra TaxID=262757 RepID=A0A6A1WJV2_9ROSI|nr:hypothetical protein CJ030_MR1G018616 [Morella rubra]
MLISRIIGTNILPAQKLSALSLDRAKFLYAFMHNDSIDLGSVMCVHVVKSFNSCKAGLYLSYACAIQKLIIMLEVPYPSSFPRMETLAKIGLSPLTQIISHKKKAQSASSSSLPPHVPSYMIDNKYMMESMKILLERTSSMMVEMSLLKADSQLTRTEVLQMQDPQEKEEADDVAAPMLAPAKLSTTSSLEFPCFSHPHKSDTEYFSSDGDNHEDLSDLD